MTARKSKTVGIHLNDDEYALIKARAEAAAARSLGAYIKATVFDKAVPEQRIIRHTKVADPELIRQLSWVGNNINQISRVLNRSVFLEPAGLAGLFAMLASIAEDIEALKKDSI